MLMLRFLKEVAKKDPVTKLIFVSFFIFISIKEQINLQLRATIW